MRNAGEGTPGGPQGRRQRPAGPPATARPPSNAGASLFTPAYRVRHAPSVPAADADDRPGTYAQRAGATGYDAGSTDQVGPGYRYSELDRPEPSHRRTGYGTDQVAPARADEGSPADYAGGYSRMADVGANTGGLPRFSERDEPRQLANAIRGFPPLPGEPLPAYPPGPFAPWNRGISQARDAGRETTAKSAAGIDSPGQAVGRRSRHVATRGMTAATITPDEFDTNHSLPAIKDPVLGKETGTTSAAAPRTAGGSRADRAPAHGHAAQSRAGRPSRASRKSRRRPVWLAIGAAVVIIAAVTAVLVLTSIGKQITSANNKPSKPPASPTSTATSSPKPSASKWGFIGTRLTDPTPLTLRELYVGSFNAHGAYFHVTITDLTRHCGNALIGGSLQAAVQRAGCSQALRASYVARRDKAMATIGVFNLRSSAAASTAALKVGRSAFVAPLAPKNGVTNKLGQGTGIDEAVVKGHYLVLVWAEYIDLAAPKTSSQRQYLTRFMDILIGSTVNASLSYRMVEGKPTPPG